ncbi:hypothetical protein BD309DRAFT_418167 [Dichomitus squalens]|nr:hypothetical protein BD309DRAFT_418167 [Dichomitus squalens]
MGAIGPRRRTMLGSRPDSPSRGGFAARHPWRRVRRRRSGSSCASWAAEASLLAWPRRGELRPPRPLGEWGVSPSGSVAGTRGRDGSLRSGWVRRRRRRSERCMPSGVRSALGTCGGNVACARIRDRGSRNADTCGGECRGVGGIVPENASCAVMCESYRDRSPQRHLRPQRTRAVQGVMIERQLGGS